MEIKRLIVVAGAGSYPRLIIRGAKSAGVATVDVLAIKGSTDWRTRRLADRVRSFGLGEIAAGVRWLAQERYDGVIFAGQVSPFSLFRTRFDAETRGWLAELKSKNAHSIFGKLISEMEKSGVRLLPASLYMDGFLPGVGQLTRRGLSAAESADIAHAMKVAADMGVHDVGQTVMVKDGMVLAVEAFEGTNAAIRRGGRLGGPGAVVFKAARRGHDMRFDIPVVGMKTMKRLRKSGATALGFQASRLILLDRDEVVAYADRHGIAIVGFDSGLPAAPLRP